MKKYLLSAGSMILLLVSCNGHYKEQIAEDSLTIAQLTSDYNQAASFNDSLMLLMGDIYNGLDSINMQEGLLYNMAGGETTDRRAEVRRNLSAIKARLEENKKLLAQMEGRVRATGNENSVLSKTIAQMKERLEQQDYKINVLESQLASARDTIMRLANQVAETQAQVKMESEAKEAAQAAYESAENSLNTVYYAIGTNKELKKNGLLEKKFLGATKVLKGNFNESYFTKADKRTLNAIHTNSKKVKIWTNMPENSFTITQNAEGLKTIEITNPNEFWSMTPFLVIQVD